ncbi:hypothetical protein AMECASPLE_013915 [Ameca splendens]|uniref:Uncharacterized protein n=1 Tax=Ameca splendens TaxID=208324 RepID=A0ABV0XEM6_9TELE
MCFLSFYLLSYFFYPFVNLSCEYDKEAVMLYDVLETQRRTEQQDRAWLSALPVNVDHLQKASHPCHRSLRLVSFHYDRKTSVCGSKSQSSLVLHNLMFSCSSCTIMCTNTHKSICYFFAFVCLTVVVIFMFIICVELLQTPTLV